MLPSKHRISLSNFLFLQTKPVPKIQNQYYRALIKKAHKGPARLVFIVPKRLSKLATQRNRTRRILSQAFLPYLSQIRPHFWLAIYSRQLLLTEKPQDLTKVIELDLKKIGLL